MTAACINRTFGSAIRAVQHLWHVQTIAARFRRLDRLIEAGRRREAERVLAILTRDTHRWLQAS